MPTHIHNQQDTSSTCIKTSIIRCAHSRDLPFFGVGHAHNVEAATGCTVIVAPAGATCGVDVRGGGPATRETDLLKPENMVEHVHAIVLAGGSAFGLEASCGVMEALAEQSIGFPAGDVRVPIVTGACLFDLMIGDSSESIPTHPDKHMGYQAAYAALKAQNNIEQQEDQRNTTFQTEDIQVGMRAAAGFFGIAEGNVGAGTGATVGKLLGDNYAMKSGVGTYFLRMGDLVVGALVAVNALGNVCDSHGRWIAGCRHTDGTVLDPLVALITSMHASDVKDTTSSSAHTNIDTDGIANLAHEKTDHPCPNTTLGVVLTNARLTKAQATKTASTTHDAYARTIKPVHTLNDGDTIFCLASGEVDVPADVVSVLATETMSYAILRAVNTAQKAYGLPAARDLAIAHTH